MKKIVLMEFSNIGVDVNAEASYEEMSEICSSLKNSAIEEGRIELAGHAAKGLAESYRRLGFLSKAEKEYFSALSLFSEINNIEGIVWAQWAFGNLLRQTSQYSNSLLLLNSAYRSSIALKDHRCAAYSLAGIAETNRILGNYAVSLRQHFIAKNIFAKLQDFRGIVWAHEGIAQIYKTSGHLDKALPLFQESKNLAEDIIDLRGLAYAEKCIGEIWSQMGKTQSAIESIYTSIALFKKIKLNIGLAYSYKSLADTYCWTEEVDRALNYYYKAKFIFKKMQDYRGLAYVNKGLGDTYFKLGFISESNSSYIHANEYFHRNRIKYGIRLMKEAAAKNQLILT